MEKEAYQREGLRVDEHNAVLLALLNQPLAKAYADLEAAQDDPALTRQHLGSLGILKLQIADADGSSPRVQKVPRPVMIHAKRPKKREAKRLEG